MLRSTTLAANGTRDCNRFTEGTNVAVLAFGKLFHIQRLGQSPRWDPFTVGVLGRNDAEVTDIEETLYGSGMVGRLSLTIAFL